VITPSSKNNYTDICLCNTPIVPRPASWETSDRKGRAGERRCDHRKRTDRRGDGAFSFNGATAGEPYARRVLSAGVLSRKPFVIPPAVGCPIQGLQADALFRYGRSLWLLSIHELRCLPGFLMAYGMGESKSGKSACIFEPANNLRPTRCCRDRSLSSAPRDFAYIVLVVAETRTIDDELLFTNPACIEATIRPASPRVRPTRLRAVLAREAAESTGSSGDVEPRGDSPGYRPVHRGAFIERVWRRCRRAAHAGRRRTRAQPGSGEARARGRRGVRRRSTRVMAGEPQRVSAAVRAARKHAEPAGPMGFCIFNHIAIARQRARQVFDGIRARRVIPLFPTSITATATQGDVRKNTRLFYASTPLTARSSTPRRAAAPGIGRDSSASPGSLRSRERRQARQDLMRPLKKVTRRSSW